jgi:ribosomal protein S18 acetylase RimI-like enzyme
MGYAMDQTNEGTEELTLAPATLADLEVVLPMMVEFNAGEQILVAGPALRSALARLLEDQSLGRVWLVRAGGATVGYGVLTFGYDLEFAGRDAYLTEFYLRRDSRGRGLGRRVLAQIEAAAALLGVRAIHLMVRPENQRAASLYATAGYRASPSLFLSKTLEPR